MPDRKTLLRQYKETPRPAGVFAVRNTTDGKALLGTSTDLPGMLNRQRFQLEMGSHPDRELQADWSRLGADAFTFEVLDELELPADEQVDIREELQTLCEMWRGTLLAENTSLYKLSPR